MKKVEMVRNIESWLKKNKLTRDVRIYFNNKCFCWYDGSKKIIEDIKGSDYFKYANDETISMSFEGPLHSVFNEHWCNKTYGALENEFDEFLKGYGYYYELGNAWNLSVYEMG